MKPRGSTIITVFPESKISTRIYYEMRPTDFTDKNSLSKLLELTFEKRKPVEAIIMPVSAKRKKLRYIGDLFLHCE